MKTSSIVAVIVALIVIVGLVWYFASAPSAGQPQTASQTASTTETSSTTGTVGGPAALAVSNSGTLGDFLVAPNGMTLYIYTPDTSDKSNCTGQCAANWPPYTVAAGTSLGSLANATGTIGTIVRADGSMQVTYNHMPLYFYIKDKQAGDTTGQGVGGVWYVLKP